MKTECCRVLSAALAALAAWLEKQSQLLEPYGLWRVTDTSTGAVVYVDEADGRPVVDAAVARIQAAGGTAEVVAVTMTTRRAAAIPPHMIAEWAPA